MGDGSPITVRSVKLEPESGMIRRSSTDLLPSHHDWWLAALLAAVVVGVLLAAMLTRGPEREDER